MAKRTRNRHELREQAEAAEKQGKAPAAEAGAGETKKVKDPKKKAAAKTPQDKAKLEELANMQSRIARDLAQVQKDLVAHAEACQEHFPKAANSARRAANSAASADFSTSSSPCRR